MSSFSYALSVCTAIRLCPFRILQYSVFRNLGASNVNLKLYSMISVRIAREVEIMVGVIKKVQVYLRVCICTKMRA